MVTLHSTWAAAQSAEMLIKVNIKRQSQEKEDAGELEKSLVKEEEKKEHEEQEKEENNKEFIEEKEAKMVL